MWRAVQRGVRKAAKPLVEPYTLRRLYRTLSPTLAAQLRRSIQNLKGRVSLDELERAIGTGSIAAIERALNLGGVTSGLGIEVVANTQQTIVDALEFAYEQALRDTSRYISNQPRFRAIISGTEITPRNVGDLPRLIPGVFDLPQPLATRFSLTRGSELVRYITEPTRESVRVVIGDALNRGLNARTVAREMARTMKDSIGLLPAQVRANARYRAKLEELGVRPDRVEMLGQKYGERQLRWRMENIARTEMKTALGTGQLEGWREFRKVGLIPPDARRGWIVNVDSRGPCPLCEELNGQSVGMEEPFVTSDGLELMSPPRHPACRCAIGLLVAEDDTTLQEIPTEHELEESEGLQPEVRASDF